MVNSSGGSFCWNYATDTFIANIQVSTSIAVMHGLRLYCNYVGGTFCYSFAGGSFFRNYAHDCFHHNYAVRSFCSIYADESFCSEHVDDHFYWNYAGGSPWLPLCRWYFLQCIMHMTISIVIVQVAVSVVAMYVTVSSNNFYFFL